MADQKKLEKAYGEGAQAARDGDLWDEFRHSLGALFAFGLQSDEEEAWDEGYSDESGEG